MGVVRIRTGCLSGERASVEPAAVHSADILVGDVVKEPSGPQVLGGRVGPESESELYLVGFIYSRQGCEVYVLRSPTAVRRRGEDREVA